jgi:hypothetical protein
MPLGDLYEKLREIFVFSGTGVSRVDTGSGGTAQSTITIDVSAEAATGARHTTGAFATTDATAATAATIDIPTGQLVRVQASWSAIDAVTDDRLVRETVAFFKNVADTVTQVGSDHDLINQEDDASWAATFSINDTDVLVRYQGDATNAVSWQITAWSYAPGN